MRDRGQEGSAQPLGFGQHSRLGEDAGKGDALDRDRRLISQRVEEPALVGFQYEIRAIPIDADHPDQPPARAQRQEHPPGTRYTRSAPARCGALFPAPARGRQVSFIEPIIGRVAAGNH